MDHGAFFFPLDQAGLQKKTQHAMLTLCCYGSSFEYSSLFHSSVAAVQHAVTSKICFMQIPRSSKCSIGYVLTFCLALLFKRQSSTTVSCTDSQICCDFSPCSFLILFAALLWTWEYLYLSICLSLCLAGLEIKPRSHGMKQP